MSGLADLSPTMVRVFGALAGAISGAVAGRAADVLPRRYDITLLVTGRARTRRNVALLLFAVAIGGWLGHVVASVQDASLSAAFVYFFTNLVLAVALVTAAAVDLEHMILPNEITLGGAALALATSHWRGIGLVGSAIGIVVGLAITYLPFLLYKRLRGRSGMGLGDAKLALLAGAWLGAPGALFVVFAGALQSSLCALVMRIFGLDFAIPASVEAELADLRAKADAGDEEAKSILADDPMAADVGGSPAATPRLSTMRLPMGPFLVLACLEFMLARRQLLELFDRYISPP